MTKYLYSPVITICFIFSSIIYADTYSKFETTDYYSKNRRFFVRVKPDKKATLYKNGKMVWTQSLPELPMKLLVTDDGTRVIMIENYYGNRRDPKKEVIIFFNEKGAKFSSQTLKDVADLKNVMHTISSSSWLENYELNQNESEIIIKTTVLTCSLIERVSRVDDLRKVDECMKPKPKEKIVFSVLDGKILSRSAINTAEK